MITHFQSDRLSLSLSQPSFSYLLIDQIELWRPPIHAGINLFTIVKSRHRVFGFGRQGPMLMHSSVIEGTG